MRQKIVLNLLTLGILASASAAWAQTTVTVNASTTYQTISGFGASSQWDNTFSSTLANTFWADDSSQPPASQVNGNVGLSILRLGIDDSGNANWGPQCAFATQALGINSKIKVFGSEWSPPAKWKNNGTVDGNNTGTGYNLATSTNQLNTADYANYAAYQTSFVTACKNTYGFNLTALSIQNEPDYDPSYDACLWSASAFDTYIKNNLGPDLQAAGVGTSIIMMPESFADNLNLSATAMGDSAAASFVGFIGMHLYGGGPNTVPASYSTTAGHTVESWETEISEKTSDNNIDSGIYYADLLHNCIVDHNFNAFCYWWLVNINTDDEGLCTSAGTPTPRLYCIGNFSKFIRPGFVRIGCTEAPSAGVSVSAYYSSSTNKVVVVAINSNTSTYNLPVSFTGLTVSTVYPWITDSTRNLVQQTSVAVSGGSFTYTLPSQSVVSFVGAVTSGSTPTFTFTSTRTNTPTNTPSSTPTKTSSATPSMTATPSSTPSRTNSPTATPTTSPTKTNSPTSTATSTASMTPTSSPSPTASRSFTPTSTASSTPTATASTTATASMTATPPFTMTATASRTPSASPSSTSTHSSTPTGTASSTPSPTATTTVSGTPSFTSTNTPLSTPTATTTSSSSPTPTRTPSATSTLTATSSPTGTIPPTLSPTATASSTSTASMTPTTTSTQTAVNTPTASPSGTFTGTATATPSASPSATPSRTPTSTATTTGTPSNSATPTSTDSMTPTVTATPSFTASRTDTSTATASSTATPTNSFTKTFTPTATLTSTPSDTSTQTPLPTSTPTQTFSTTSTPPENSKVVIYPNPASGGPVNLLPPAYWGPENVKVEIFTVSFRKVFDKTFDGVPPGVPVTLSLNDQWGRPLASGVYYVVVTVDGHRFFAKLLILR